LPSGVKMEQLPTGTVIVTESTPVVAVAAVGLYARVSSSDQKGDLEAQMGRLVSYASSQGWAVTRAVSEVGSGLNGRRAKLIKLLADPEVTTIVVEHRDRLMRFGVEYVEALLAAQGRRLIVVDHAEVKDDLVQDMIEVLTSFCARLYGRRSAKNRAEKAMKAMHG
jgi:putative resolvase